MKLGISMEPQRGASYETQLRVALLSEAAGFASIFRADHLLWSGSDSVLPGPTETWATLAALARDTQTIRLGSLMTSATFRWPGVLAVTVAQVDQMSGGRVDFGLGAGHLASEHAAYGIPFPASLRERLDRLEEQLQIIKGMWSTPAGERFDHRGSYYRLDNSPALPKPAQHPHPPVIVGGLGRTRTPAIAARYADELNMALVDVSDIPSRMADADQQCELLERDPRSLARSAFHVMCVADNARDLERRLSAASFLNPSDVRASPAFGSPREVVEKLAEFQDQGVERMYLQMIDLEDLDHVNLVASEVLPAFL